MVERRRESNWSMQVTALYDYEPEQPDELGFQEGDVLRVQRVQDDGWWSGYDVKNPDIVGLFPSNYVQALRNAPPQENTTILSDNVRTPRPPDSARKRISLQTIKVPDTPELDDEDEDDDKVQELPSEFRGHIGTVLQLRRNLEEAERASEAARDARRQAERERLRHRNSWREGQRDEAESEADLNQQDIRHQQEAHSDNEEDNEDEDELVYPHQQGAMHESDRQDEEEGVKYESGLNGEVESHTDATADTAEVENAAATLIARGYKRHCALAQRNREAEQHQTSEIAAVCIQRWAAHAYSRQRKRRQRELEQSTARRRWEREHEAAGEIQKWIRLRWACFWRRRVQAERQGRVAEELQQEELQPEQRASQHHTAELAAKQTQKAEEEEEDNTGTQEGVENGRVLQRKREDDERQLQFKVVEAVRLRFLQEHEEGNNQHEVEPAVPSESVQVYSPDKPRRKVMKKEAVELIKTLVRQQLGETLRDHDAKMEELQRMVAKLQTVVRKQTVMLEDSTDRFVNLQMTRQQEQRLPKVNASTTPFLPKVTGPRQPVALSGLRAPRPVVLSKLPLLASNGTNRKRRNEATIM